MKALILLLLVIPTLVTAETLVINVSGIKPGKGDVRLGVFNGPEEFPEGSYYKGVAIPGDSETMRLEIEGLAPGSYAVSVFQDLDGTEKLDKNFVGMPKEPYGFSGKWRGGGSSFQDALIELQSGGTEITIKMK